MGLSAGTRLGPYEIVVPLGAGGMGEVYRARDTRLGRDVAVKVLPEAFVSDPERLARFEREARTVAGLNHPGIVTLYSIEDEAGARFLTMELVEGRGLDEHIVPGGLPLERVLEISIALAEALAAAHGKGVVHRDLKPANVMLTREGRVKVLDFGLAKPARPGNELESTQGLTQADLSGTGLLLGTLPYMAPEQVRGEPVDARTDLFAFGVIVYELATGRRPFAGATSADVTSSILRDPPLPLAALRAGLPGELERIVARCLEKSPGDRYQSALEVMNDLRQVRRSQHNGAPVLPRAAALREIPSIAVLPFVSRSRDQEDEYFSDGLADELLNVLAKIRGLRVAARSSSFHFKGKDTTVSEVGRALNVAAVLEGSVRKSGNRVRIAVQLVKVSDGFHLWSETYDRTLDDIFAVQDDIAQSVLKELRTTLLGESPDSRTSGEVKAEVAAAARGRGESGEAHRLFLQGRFLVDRLARSDVLRGMEYLEEALKIDPGHALAWAWLSQGCSYAAGYGWLPLAEGYARARETALRALELEPDLVEGHLAVGAVQTSYDWDWKGADASFRRALELAPGSAHVLRAAGNLTRELDRLDEAVTLHRRAVEQDPLSVGAYYALGTSCRAAGLLPEAEDAFRRVLEISPQRAAAHMMLGLVLLEEGRLDDALVEAERESEIWARLFVLAAIHHTAGRREESDRALQDLIRLHAGEAAIQIAGAHAWRGETDAAFEWLDRACAQRDAGLPILRTDPVFRSLHGDPRWVPLLRKMGMLE